MKLLKSYVQIMSITAAAIFSMDDGGYSAAAGDPTGIPSNKTSSVSNSVLALGDGIFLDEVGPTSSDYSPKTIHRLCKETARTDLTLSNSKTPNIIEVIKSLENILLAIQSQHSAVLIVLADLKARLST